MTRLEQTLLRSLSTAVPLAAVLLGWATPAFPHAGNSNPNDVHACVGRNSKIVRIVGVNGHCVGHPRFLAERAVHWPGAAASPSAQSAQGTRPLRFVDATGRQVGLAIAHDRAVLDLPDGALVAVGVSRSGFVETEQESSLYDSFDCTGPGYLDADTASNFAGVTGSIATYRDFAAATSRTTNSVLLPGGDCFAFTRTGPVAPPVTFDLSTLGLVPPFTLAK
jgi:hypothetical protein